MTSFKMYTKINPEAAGGHRVYAVRVKAEDLGYMRSHWCKPELKAGDYIRLQPNNTGAVVPADEFERAYAKPLNLIQ